MAGFLIRQRLPDLLLAECAISPALFTVLLRIQETMKGIYSRDAIEAGA
jgi:hypothetical protein